MYMHTCTCIRTHTYITHELCNLQRIHEGGTSSFDNKVCINWLPFTYVSGPTLNVQKQKCIDASAAKQRTPGLNEMPEGGTSSLKKKVSIVGTHTYFTYVWAHTPNVQEQKRIDASAGKKRTTGLEKKLDGGISSLKNKVLIVCTHTYFLRPCTHTQCEGTETYWCVRCKTRREAGRCDFVRKK